MHIMFCETATTMTINLENLTVENWLYSESMHTHYKTADQCQILFEDTEGKHHLYEGYVPKFFPNKHFGDYIMLGINADGTLENFICTDDDIQACLAKSR